MSKKLKTLIYIIVIAVAVVITAVIFSFTLFTVKDIKIDFKTSVEGTYSEEEIIEKSGLNYGKCVFFLKKNQFSSNIEQNFPYLEVINIETKIPSHIIIHLAERQEFYAISYNEQMLICDDEFKVLKIENGTTYSSNIISLSGEKLNIKNENIVAGTFLDIEQKGLYDLYNCMLENSRTRSEMLATFRDINVCEYEQKEVIKDGKEIVKEYQTTICMTTFSGRKIYISNIDYGLKYKLQKMFAVLSRIMEVKQFKYDGQNYDYDTSSEEVKGTIIEILTKAEIHVENYLSEYDYDEESQKVVKVRSEKDCFYYLQYNGKKLESYSA